MKTFTVEEYEVAMAFMTDEGASLPGHLRWSTSNRDGRADALVTNWPRLSLEDRISHVATDIGFYVPAEGSPHHVITYGYELLCRQGTLWPA